MYPTLWWHDHKRERSITVKPDSKGDKIPGREALAAKIWQTASCLHFSLDFNTNSSAIVVCNTPTPSLGGRAWPTFRCSDPKWAAVLALWCNSTLGLITFWSLGSKQHSGRSINTVTKLPALLVLDPRKLSERKLDLCNRKFECFSKKPLLPASSAFKDENRMALDAFVLDELCDASAEWQADFSTIRTHWCLEPIVGGTHED